MILDTVHKRKSFTITSVILLMLLLLMFLSGMKYLDPPQEKGITITFGTDLQGMGEMQPASSTPQTEEVPEEIPEETPIPEEIPSEDDKQEEVVTQDTNEETPVIAQNTKKKQKKEDSSPKTQTQPKEPEKPKPSSETTDALASILGTPKKTENNARGGGQGDDNVNGHKGSLDGNPYSNSYYGSGGSGGNGKGWGLNGRSLQGGEKIAQECNEEGRVVVEIEVDQTGKVVKIKPGVRGTNNSHPCLIEAARKTAQTYRWNADSRAPQRQIGFIEINFRLGE